MMVESSQSCHHITAKHPSMVSKSLTLAESLSLTDEARVVCESAPPYRIIHTNVAWKEACGFSFIEVAGKTCSVLQALI